ncbi:hypothetical protein D3C79_794880 [compost metagenome]
MRVQRQIATHEGEATGNHNLEAVLLLVQGAQMLGAALGDAVGMRCIKRVRHGVIALADGVHVRWLGAIDTTGTGQQKARDSMSGGIVQQVTGTVNDLGIPLQRAKLRTCRRIRCGVKHVRKTARPGQRSRLQDVALMQAQPRLTGKLGVLRQETLR